MILEDPVLPFGQWLLGNLPSFLGVLLALALAGLFLGFLMAALRHGPVSAVLRTGRGIAEGFHDLRQLSLRRVTAMARLAFQESLRSKVLVAFALFVIMLLFAGWFLDVESDSPERLYLSFVLQSTNYLVLVLAMFLSSFSLPNDMKNRTIYTVVTKPVRAWEIVLGRICGFVAIGSLMIFLMWISSYIFVVTGLRHHHDVDVASMTPLASGSSNTQGVQGRTTFNSRHRHNFNWDANAGSSDMQRSHWHAVRKTGESEDAEFEVGRPRDMLLARVPIRATELEFLDPAGNPTESGISVGKEWRYRDYVEGGTAAAAIWTFDGITQRDFPRSLRMEMTIRVFRTYIGDIERGINGIIVLQNPVSGLQALPIPFTAKEFTPQQINIERELEGRAPDGRVTKIDLHDDLVHEGSLEIKIQCMEPSQYFGMALADVYLRTADSWFGLNFAKGYVGIWFQMVMVVGFGVMFSTILSGAVALLTTLSTIVTGFFAQFIVDVATGEAEGGGPAEAMIRIFKQMNLVTPLDPNISTTVVQGFDSVVMPIMRAVAFVLPDYGGLSTTHFVAYGFDVPAVLILQHLTVTVAYLIVVTCVGYFLLKSREIAA